jgi:hypothetical protein
MQNKLRIAIDMDEVIVDAYTAQVTWYEQQYGYKWSEPDVEGVLGVLAGAVVLHLS